VLTPFGRRGHITLAISGKIRKHYIRILPDAAPKSISHRSL